MTTTLLRRLAAATAALLAFTAVPALALLLPQLLPAGARGFAVVDLETTGTGQLCRIVEIALLLLSPGMVERTLRPSGLIEPRALAEAEVRSVITP